MIDFHTHSLLSDGALLPSELARRARVAGYRAVGITDHADESNLESVIEQTTRVCVALNRDAEFKVVPGVELTHIPPADIPALVERARALGAKIVVGHGETLAEPVSSGTNMAYIRAGVDILAHPGMVTDNECSIASAGGVHFEITSRKGHCLSNGHVAMMAKKHKVKMLVNSDSHAPGDLLSDDFAILVATGAGLDNKDYRKIVKNAQALLKKVLR